MELLFRRRTYRAFRVGAEGIIEEQSEKKKKKRQEKEKKKIPIARQPPERPKPANTADIHVCTDSRTSSTVTHGQTGARQHSGGDGDGWPYHERVWNDFLLS